MKARYNYRIYPKVSQLQSLAKAMGCARVVFNDALWLYKKAEIENTDRPKNISSLVITQAKKTEERAWLGFVSAVVLQQSLRDLQTAWGNYFNSKKGQRKGKDVGRPKFKKKQSRQAIRFTTNAFSVHSESVKLAKIGHVRMMVTRPLPSAPSSVTIIKDCAGRYFASFVVEVNQPIPPQTTQSIGIDLGLTHFAILSTSVHVENPRLHKKMLRKIKKTNRRLAKALKDSNRRKRRKLKLAKLHAKVKDQRTDFLHKLTTRLVRENQTLAVEDLNVSGLVKNRKLSRAISDAGWFKLAELATLFKCPVVCEELDFFNKKMRLKEVSRKLARMLSGWAYSEFFKQLSSILVNRGIELKTVNPAYTSLIGLVKYVKQYGISSGVAAAISIARRGMYLKEKMSSSIKAKLSVNEGMHSWSYWNKLNKLIKTCTVISNRHSYYSISNWDFLVKEQ